MIFSSLISTTDDCSGNEADGEIGTERGKERGRERGSAEGRSAWEDDNVENVRKMTYRSTIGILS